MTSFAVPIGYFAPEVKDHHPVCNTKKFLQAVLDHDDGFALLAQFFDNGDNAGNLGKA